MDQFGVFNVHTHESNGNGSNAHQTANILNFHIENRSGRNLGRTSLLMSCLCCAKASTSSLGMILSKVISNHLVCGLALLNFHDLDHPIDNLTKLMVRHLPLHRIDQGSIFSQNGDD